LEVNVERLKELRRERVLSLRELEERSGVSYNTIWRLEDGRQGRILGPCGSWRRLWAWSPPSW
jgi:transcriptional regulator with XRE-family HTH domain